MTCAPEVSKWWSSERKSRCSISTSYSSSQVKQMQPPIRPIYLELAHSPSMELKMSKQRLHTQRVTWIETVGPKSQITVNIILDRNFNIYNVFFLWPVRFDTHKERKKRLWQPHSMWRVEAEDAEDMEMVIDAEQLRRLE